MVGEQSMAGRAGSDEFVMPAEVEPHSAIWMGWPKDQWYADSALDTRPPIAGIMAALAAHGIGVQLMCTDRAGEQDARRWLAAHGFSLTARVNFVHIDPVDIWLRDYGPTFTRNGAGQLGMARFRQNQWGYDRFRPGFRGDDPRSRPGRRPSRHRAGGGGRLRQ